MGKGIRCTIATGDSGGRRGELSFGKDWRGATEAKVGLQRIYFWRILAL